MSILWCGGEDIDFPYGVSLVSSTVAQLRRSAYSRVALIGPNAANTANSRSVPFLGGPVTSCWLSARVSPANSGKIMMGLGVSGGLAGLCVAYDTAGRLALRKTNGVTETPLATETGISLAQNVVTKVDMEVIDYGVNGTVNLYANGVLIVSYAGDIQAGGATALDCAAIWAGAGLGGGYISEMIVADEDTRLFSLATLAPNAAGDANAWTGAHTDINEPTVNDATTLHTDTPGLDAQVGLSEPPAGAFTVRGVYLSARVSKSVGATAGSVCLGVRNGGVTDPGTPQACTTAWTPAQRVMVQNPVTGNIWQLSEVNALQLNLRSAV